MVFPTTAETNRRITGSVLYIFYGGQSRKLYSVKLRSMNPARVQAKHDVDQWSKKQRRRQERKYILIARLHKVHHLRAREERKYSVYFGTNA